MNASDTRWSNSGKVRVNNARNSAETDPRGFTVLPALSHTARDSHSSRRNVHSIEEPVLPGVPGRRPSDFHLPLDVPALRALAPAS